MADEELRTLFVSGLPLDVKSREIYLLFRYYQGFSDSIVNFGKQPVAFVVFETQQQALAAKLQLDGIIFDPFDPESPTKLRIGLLVPQNVLASPKPNLISARARPWSPSAMVTGGALGLPFMNVIPTQPCNTLFVANLGPKTSEEELQDLFTRCYGFRRLRVNLKSATPVCFVEFQDIACASQAMNLLQGFQLASCDRGGMKIEYAKNPMGVPSQKKRMQAIAPVAEFLEWVR
mmetsp:Transcript_46001/g.75033  ORF Transcript_46001/g.75033 Transcript_46001/m.75033 type:complete len:233 (+) Transcript_46001:159-857(+)|eukprot:CAMPEP_0184657248 /NCGR_PEP_ID=MMETSP0308-20130426/18002_1 /TAXON_ID=38269 /ORGANISM="Gloeochaete witrockiana, Strain SAG 46.84" /LENGTH=232 /DNA_ID=CAMNT_0027094849 /DNA_START=74 /DNA_END=772 /DNA_ORIENTATION=+